MAEQQSKFNFQTEIQICIEFKTFSVFSFDGSETSYNETRYSGHSFVPDSAKEASMLIFQSLENICENYDDSRSTVARFLLENKRDLDNYSMQNIADETYTSKSTLVRFAKLMGFSGWTDFIAKYKAEIVYLDQHVSGIDPNIPFDVNASVTEIAGALSAIKASGIAETLALMDASDYEKAADWMDKASRICLFGISINRALGEIFQHKMVLIGRSVEIIDHSEMKFLACTMNKNDLAIVISYSGNSLDRVPVSILGRLRDNEVPIIGITSLGTNVLSEKADLVFRIASKERLYSKIGSFYTEASISTILDMLYSVYFARNYSENLAHKKYVSTKVEKRRTSDAEGIQEPASSE